MNHIPHKIKPVLMSIGFLVLSILFFSGCSGYASQAAPNTNVNSSDDYTYLLSYGRWFDLDPYGEVWQPDVSPDWRPFAYGHWMRTDTDDWAWVSYEPYGWLVYHYGDWGYEPDIGWFWVEGNEWSPARVEWMNYDGYSCWAPIPPPSMAWSEPWVANEFEPWNVVQTRDIDRDNIIEYRISNPPPISESGKSTMSRRPVDVGRVEKLSGRHIRAERMKHESAPVFMRPSVKPIPKIRPPEENGRTKIEREEIPLKEKNPVHLRRMVLPDKEAAKAKIFRRDVERKVLRPHKKPAKFKKTDLRRNQQ